MKRTKSKPPHRDSLYRMARKLKVSRSTLYTWKEEGAPIQDGEDAVLKWAMSEGRGKGQSAKDDGDALRAAKLRVLQETAAHKRTIRLKLEGKLIPIDIVAAGRSIAVKTFCAELERIKRDMPAVLKGLPEQGIREKLTAHIAGVKPRIVESFDKIGEGESEA